MDDSGQGNIDPNNNNFINNTHPPARTSNRITYKRSFLSDEQSHIHNESQPNNNIDHRCSEYDSGESNEVSVELDEILSSSESDEKLAAASVITTMSTRSTQRIVSEEQKKQQQIAIENDAKLGWTAQPAHIAPQQSNIQRGITTRVRLEREIDFFNLFVNDIVMSEWVTATNSNARQSECKSSWSDTNLSEMRHFVAVLIYMGIHESSNLHDYFSAVSRSAFVTNLFSRDQFTQLHSKIHMSIGERNTADRIWRVRSFVNHLKEGFRSVYQPSQVLVVDEPMCHTKARLNMKQYISAKPYKWGIKICCIENEGYLLGFIVYQGADSTTDTHTPKQALRGWWKVTTITIIWLLWAVCSRLPGCLKSFCGNHCRLFMIIHIVLLVNKN